MCGFNLCVSVYPCLWLCVSMLIVVDLLPKVQDVCRAPSAVAAYLWRPGPGRSGAGRQHSTAREPASPAKHHHLQGNHGQRVPIQGSCPVVVLVVLWTKMGSESALERTMFLGWGVLASQPIGSGSKPWCPVCRKILQQALLRRNWHFASVSDNFLFFPFSKGSPSPPSSPPEDLPMWLTCAPHSCLSPVKPSASPP